MPDHHNNSMKITDFENLKRLYEAAEGRTTPFNPLTHKKDPAQKRFMFRYELIHKKWCRVHGTYSEDYTTTTYTPSPQATPKPIPTLPKMHTITAHAKKFGKTVTVQVSMAIEAYDQNDVAKIIEYEERVAVEWQQVEIHYTEWTGYDRITSRRCATLAEEIEHTVQIWLRHAGLTELFKEKDLHERLQLLLAFRTS